MIEQAKSDSAPFPGSPTGNRSGVGAGESKPKTEDDTQPTSPFPGSPTGNASGTGASGEATKER